jgi:hypothetical protein
VEGPSNWVSFGELERQGHQWLKDHCKNHPATIGYAVWLNLAASPVEICVDRIDSNGMRRLPC